MSQLQVLFMDGHSSSFHNANPSTTYSPTVIGGSLTNEGNIGNGDISMTSTNSGTGGGFNFSIPGMGGGSGGSPSAGGDSGSGSIPSIPDIPSGTLQNLWSRNKVAIAAGRSAAKKHRLAVLLI